MGAQASLSTINKDALFFSQLVFLPSGAPWALGSAKTVEDLRAGLETEVRDGVSGLRGKGKVLVSGDA